MSAETPRYRICLIGSGGVGTIASLVLTKSGLAHVTCVLRSSYAHISQHGWDIDSIDHGKLSGWKPHRVVHSADEAATDTNKRPVKYDYVVVCTKQLPGLNPIPAMISHIVTPEESTIVMIQNGMGIEEDVIQAWPGNAVMSSVSHIGSSMKSPNIVVQIGKDVSKMGPHLHAGIDDAISIERSKEFVNMYNMGGASVCEWADDIQVARWEKLLWNGTFNTLCALMRMDVGELQRSKGRETILVPMMWEIWNIAKGAGHLMPESIVEWMAYRLPDDCNYRPSMLLDLENRRPMELDVILGNPLRKALDLGVETPCMSMVHKLLKLEEWKISQSKM
ncbi:2-dehydropantoate 2-reductase [Penicillium longicatenatum]|nr:2-dehydropantoate 2-reductase [Penicillium longicatenatum]